MMFASGWADWVIRLDACSTSSRPMSGEEVMLIITPLAPAIEGFQQRAGNGGLCRVLALPAPLGAAHTHMGVAGVLHDAAHVGKIQVDEGGDIDQAGNALTPWRSTLSAASNAFIRVIFSWLMSFSRSLGITIRLSTTCISRAAMPCSRQVHLAAALKGKGLGHNAHCQNAQVVGDLRPPPGRRRCRCRRPYRR